MKNKLKTDIVGIFIFFIFVSILLVQMTSAVLISDQGTDVKNKSTGTLLSLGNLSISIYDSSTGGTLIYQSNTSNAIVNGSWNLMISPDLEFGKYYWKDYAINEEDLDFDGNERVKFQSTLGLINNVSFINFSLINYCQPGYSIRLIYANGSVECEADDSGNGTSSDLTNYALKNQSENFAGDVNVSGNVTTTNYGFFGWLGSLASRITKLFVQDIDVSGNVNVTGNVTASYFIGNGSLLTGITSSSTYNTTYHNYIIANISNNTNCWQGNCNISYFYPYSNPLGFITAASTDSWSSNYTFYYNKSQIDYNMSLISGGTDTWSLNYTNYPTKDNLYANLTLALFANGSRALSGDLNLAGFNITNVGNITAGYICNSSTCYTLAQFLATTASTDSWAGNYTFYYNGTIVNTIVASNDTWRTNYSSYLTGANVNSALLSNLSNYLFANGSRALSGDLNLAGFNITNVGNITAGYICNSTTCYTLAQFLAQTASTDTWSLNYTNYPTKNDLYANLSLALLANGSRVLTGDLNLGGFNITNVGNITAGYICNSTTCYTLAQFLAQTASTDSWSTNYTDYYNKTRIDENFTNFMSIVSWNTNITNIFAQINANYTSSLTTCNANINNNLTSINTNINNNLTSANSYANSIVASNDTFRTNYSSYFLISSWNTNLTNIFNQINLNYTSSLTTSNANINNNYTSSLTTCNANINNNLTQINTNLYGNLSLTLLANGSRAGTGNFNFGGYNISNIDNLTLTGDLNFGSNQIYSNTTCIKIQGSTSLLEIC